MTVRTLERNTGDNVAVPTLMLAQSMLLIWKRVGEGSQLKSYLREWDFMASILKSYLKDVVFECKNILRQTFVSYIFHFMIVIEKYDTIYMLKLFWNIFNILVIILRYKNALCHWKHIFSLLITHKISFTLKLMT